MSTATISSDSQHSSTRTRRTSLVIGVLVAVALMAALLVVQTRHSGSTTPSNPVPVTGLTGSTPAHPTDDAGCVIFRAGSRAC